MNKLYAILISLVTAPSGYYVKKHTPVTNNTKSLALLRKFTAMVPDDSMCMFACAVCALAVESMFRNEILALDPENTYQPVGRDPSVPDGSASACMQPLMLPAEQMKSVMGYLDEDIRARLIVPSWPEVASGVCLQLLRDVE